MKSEHILCNDNESESIRPPYAPSDFEENAAEDVASVVSDDKTEQSKNSFNCLMIPTIRLPKNPDVLLDQVFEEINSDKAGSGPMAALYMISVCKGELETCIDDKDIESYLNLLTLIIDKVADKTQVSIFRRNRKLN